MAKSMVLISFYFEALQAMKKRLPWLNTSFLTNTYSDTDADKAATLGPNSGIDAGAMPTSQPSKSPMRIAKD